MTSGENSAGHPVIEAFTLGPFETNCYIVSVPERQGCWIVDASWGIAALLEEVVRRGLVPERLILTHAHVDHIAGVEDVQCAYPELPILLHETEQAWMSDPIANLSVGCGMPVVAPEATELVRGGELLSLEGTEWEILHTPGHSPGGITLWHAVSQQAIVGDTLFNGSVGRTDFPGSDASRLATSIRSRLYTLPDETRVYPGHGPTTLVGREALQNPFVRRQE